MLSGNLSASKTTVTKVLFVARTIFPRRNRKDTVSTETSTTLFLLEDEVKADMFLGLKEGIVLDE